MSREESENWSHQLGTLNVLRELLQALPHFPLMVWTVAPHGMTGEPYGARDDAARSEAIDRWAQLLDATHWEPETADGMTTLRASVKNYRGSGTSIILRTKLFGDTEISESVDQ